MRIQKGKFIQKASIFFLISFLLWTILVKYVDVKPIGPNNSSVGLATINGMIHNLTGVNMSLYIITDWLGLVPIIFCIGFAVLGLIQWIKRKSIFKVDYNILILGVYYVVVFALYILFEYIVNYRPTLINGCLEASYPSSTILLVPCVMPTAIMQLKSRIKNDILKKCVVVLLTSFIMFMVIGRLISGVHWISDIIGGILLSAGLVKLYKYVSKI